MVVPTIVSPRSKDNYCITGKDELIENNVRFGGKKNNWVWPMVKSKGVDGDEWCYRDFKVAVKPILRPKELSNHWPTPPFTPFGLKNDLTERKSHFGQRKM